VSFQDTIGRTWPYAEHSFSSTRVDSNGPPPKPYTDEELGFRIDDDLRAGISSDNNPVLVQNSLLIQACRIGDRILKKLEGTPPPA
jgi:hypothetical protein